MGPAMHERCTRKNRRWTAIFTRILRGLDLAAVVTAGVGVAQGTQRQSRPLRGSAFAAALNAGRSNGSGE